MKSLLDKVNAKLNAQGGFLKAVSVLVGGTAFAQALAVVVLPIITRLYSPEEFGLFAVYASILSILAVISCLRFEIAIPLPKKNENALNIFFLALLSNFLVTFILIIVIFFFQEQIFNAINKPDLQPFAWLIPVGVFFTGLYSALQYWTTRQKQFSVIAKTRMTQSVAASTVQVGGGYLGLGVLGLILGQIISTSIGLIRLSINFWQENKYNCKKISITKLKYNYSLYDKFLKYSTFESLANVAAIQLPIIIIAAFSVGAEAGYLMLAMKVMAIPMGLIGGAIAQVYLAHAPAYHEQDKLAQYTVKTIKQVAKLSFLPLTFIALFSSFIFPVVFGSAWSKAGDMILWMAPWFIMQIVSSPVSMSLHITNNQRTALLLQIVGFFVRVGGLLVVSIIYSDLMFEYYAISGFIFYTLYLIVILTILGVKLKDFFLNEI